MISTFTNAEQVQLYPSTAHLYHDHINPGSVLTILMIHPTCRMCAIQSEFNFVCSQPIYIILLDFVSYP